MGKFMLHARVLSQEMIADKIYSIWLEAKEIALSAVPGQFVSVYSNDSGHILPRPLSICETDRRHGAIRLVYRIAGYGTAEFARCTKGDSLDILGPLGNGFPADRCTQERTALLIGGGIGLPPLVQLAAELKGKVQVIAGYRDEIFLTDELGKNGSLYISVEDMNSEKYSGSLRGNIHTAAGNVLDCVRKYDLCADIIYACGPSGMLRAVKSYAQEKGIECYLSLEQRMACGIGACLACVCESEETDSHLNVKYKRVCKEGPVFAAEDIIL